MGVLSSFLNQTGRAWRDAAAEREATLADWRGAVARLYDQLRAWLGQADPDRLIRVTESTIELLESKLGLYQVPALTISFGASLVHFVPVARYAAGIVPARDGGQNRPAAGCVAVNTTRQVSSSSPDYRLYLASDAGSDRWYVSAGGPPDTEFTREVFERMLVGLLS